VLWTEPYREILFQLDTSIFFTTSRIVSRTVNFLTNSVTDIQELLRELEN
jgi:hypothetical protein